jgi:hypothetical protein
MIADQTHWELGGQIAAAKEKISSILNQPQVNPDSPSLLFGSVNAIRPVGVYSNSDSFRIVVIIDGNVSLNLDNSL